MYNLEEIEKVKSYLSSISELEQNNNWVKINVNICIGKFVQGIIVDKRCEEIDVGDNLDFKKVSFKVHTLNQKENQEEIILITEHPVNINFFQGNYCPKSKRYELPTFTKTNSPVFLIKNMSQLINNIFGEDTQYEKLKNFLLGDMTFTCPNTVENLQFDKSLHKKQIELISKAIGLLDDENAYFLLSRGPPGTGKTTCITEIIKKFIDRNNGRKILLSSFTNIAVDNVLKNLATNENYKDKIIRLGDTKSIRIKEVKGIAGQKIEDRHLVIGATLDTVGLEKYQDLEFDLVILDESSMIELPRALLGISKAKKFLMIGDNKQLPPIYKNDENEDNDNPEMIRILGLFNNLMENFEKNFCVKLEVQHRCAPEIISFSNREFYDNTLNNSDTEEFQKQMKKYNKILRSNQFVLLNKIQKLILNPKTPLVFIDTSKLITNRSYNSTECPLCLEDSRRNKDNRKCTNQNCLNRGKEWYRKYINSNEVAIAIKLVELICKLNDELNIDKYYWRNIGFISPFRNQISAFRAILARTCAKTHPALRTLNKREMWDNLDLVRWLGYIDEIEAGTVHKYQGREKDIIIFSTAHAGGGIPRLLQEDPLLNVALTRAKNKLIIIGSLEYNQESQYKKLYRSLPNNSKYSISDEDLNHLVPELEEYIQHINKFVVGSDDINNSDIDVIPTRPIRYNQINVRPEYQNYFNNDEVNNLVKEKTKYIIFDMKNNALFDYDSVDKHKEFMDDYKKKGVYDELFFRESINGNNNIEKINSIKEKLKNYNPDSYIYQSLLKELFVLEINIEIENGVKSEEELLELIESKNKELLYSYIHPSIVNNYTQRRDTHQINVEKIDIPRKETQQNLGNRILGDITDIKQFTIGETYPIQTGVNTINGTVERINEFGSKVTFKLTTNKNNIVFYDFKNKQFENENGDPLVRYQFV